MRLAFINKVILDSTLPAVNFSFSLVMGLAEAGNQVYFYAQKQKYSFDEEELYRIFNHSKEPNLQINISQKKKLLGFSSATFFYLNCVIKIIRLHLKNPFDAIITRDPNALAWMMLFKFFRIKTAYQPHNFYLDLKLHTDVNSKNASKYHFLERHFLPHIDRIICLQEAQQSLYAKYLSYDKLRVAHPGQAEAHPILKIVSDPLIFAYIGSMQAKKGIDIIINAFEQASIAHSELWLIGGRNAKELDPIQNLIAASPLSNQIKLMGWMPWKQVSELLYKIHVGIIPLHDTFYNRYLTAPNKLFDYWAYGTPVIASDLPSIRCFIKDSSEALLFPAEGVLELAHAMQTLAQDAFLYSAMNSAAIEKAKAYQWKQRAVDFVAALK